MPELPEAEFARESLASWLAGRSLRDLRIPDARTRRGQSEAEIRRVAVPKTVREVGRRGKFLWIGLDGGEALLNHLGMTGKWRCLGPEEADPPATRATLGVGLSSRVVFLDPRRFGFLSRMVEADRARLARLGPEPLGRGFTAAVLRSLLRASRRPVKTLLMDQDRLAGLGNIQATESLFRAGIHPARPASSLRPAETARLHRAIRKTLRKTIEEARGTRLRYLSEGSAVRNPFRAYGKAGAACPACRSGAIVRTVLAGRSNFHCPDCQPFANPLPTLRFRDRLGSSSGES